jgi:hypothetical protein
MLEIVCKLISLLSHAPKFLLYCTIPKNFDIHEGLNRNKSRASRPILETENLSAPKFIAGFSLTLCSSKILFISMKALTETKAGHPHPSLRPGTFFCAQISLLFCEDPKIYTSMKAIKETKAGNPDPILSTRNLSAP